MSSNENHSHVEEDFINRHEELGVHRLQDDQIQIDRPEGSSGGVNEGLPVQAMDEAVNIVENSAQSNIDDNYHEHPIQSDTAPTLPNTTNPTSPRNNNPFHPPFLSYNYRTHDPPHIGIPFHLWEQIFAMRDYHRVDVRREDKLVCPLCMVEHLPVVGSDRIAVAGEDGAVDAAGDDVAREEVRVNEASTQVGGEGEDIRTHLNRNGSELSPSHILDSSSVDEVPFGGSERVINPRGPWEENNLNRIRREQGSSDVFASDSSEIRDERIDVPNESEDVAPTPQPQTRVVNLGNVDNNSVTSSQRTHLVEPQTVSNEDYGTGNVVQNVDEMDVGIDENPDVNLVANNAEAIEAYAESNDDETSRIEIVANTVWEYPNLEQALSDLISPNIDRHEQGHLVIDITGGNSEADTETNDDETLSIHQDGSRRTASDSIDFDSVHLNRRRNGDNGSANDQLLEGSEIDVESDDCSEVTIDAALDGSNESNESGSIATQDLHNLYESLVGRSQQETTVGGGNSSLNSVPSLRIRDDSSTGSNSTLPDLISHYSSSADDSLPPLASRDGSSSDDNPRPRVRARSRPNRFRSMTIEGPEIELRRSMEERYSELFSFMQNTGRGPQRSNDNSSGSNRIKHLRDYGAIKVFASATCPICLEDHNVVVALKCGHCLCEDDFRNLGGYLASEKDKLLAEAGENTS